MITEKQQLETQNFFNTRNSSDIPRYFVDVRIGCGAVRDKWHESYDEDYSGLHSDTPDVVEYKHGYIASGVWRMKDEDVKYLIDLCEHLNNEV